MITAADPTPATPSKITPDIGIKALLAGCTIELPDDRAYHLFRPGEAIQTLRGHETSEAHHLMIRATVETRGEPNRTVWLGIDSSLEDLLHLLSQCSPLALDGMAIAAGMAAEIRRRGEDRQRAADTADNDGVPPPRHLKPDVAMRALLAGVTVAVGDINLVLCRAGEEIEHSNGKSETLNRPKLVLDASAGEVPPMAGTHMPTTFAELMDEFAKLPQSELFRLGASTALTKQPLRRRARP